MIGSVQGNEYEYNSIGRQIEEDLHSERLSEIADSFGEDFRSLLNTTIRENSVRTAETNRLVNSKLTNQVSRKLDEMKVDLNSQIQQATDISIAKKVLAHLQNRQRGQVSC